MRFIEISYIIILILVCLRIIYDTRNSAKTLAYLLFAIFIPVAGIAFYFTFGVNYRKRLIYSKKLVSDEITLKKLEQNTIELSGQILKRNAKQIGNAGSLVTLLMNDSISPFTDGNIVKLLINGEQKFSEVLNVIANAKHHIHLEYYIYENDNIGNKIKDLLISKSKQGVKVRFIYDDLGSRHIRGTFIEQMKAAGIEAYPFNKVKLIAFANRINYRNHRKIIIVDGQTGFIGGINIADRYINNNHNQQYWRDTHLRIDGPGILFLQHLFLCDWNFCSPNKIQYNKLYFNALTHNNTNTCVQIAASGPDSPTATIKLTFLKAINLAQKQIQITTPYLIPGSGIIDALKISAMVGVKVMIIVPGSSDSWLVNAAARSNYGELIKAGVEIYEYQKGFIHAKTMVIDGYISCVGSANMDYRSFDLNFEVNAIIYSSELGQQLQNTFYNDLKNSKLIIRRQWKKRPFYIKLAERAARLFSPLL